jgi:hypothetical protein
MPLWNGGECAGATAARKRTAGLGLFDVQLGNSNVPAQALVVDRLIMVF